LLEGQVMSVGRKNSTAPADGLHVAYATGIVSAYVRNNTVGMSAALPDLIRSVHAALVGLSRPVRRRLPEPPKPAVPVKRSIFKDYLDLPGGRAEVQVPEAPPALEIWSVAGRIPPEMGLAGGLSDGRARLFGKAVETRQENGPRPHRTREE
jgi:hypothetical protein